MVNVANPGQCSTYYITVYDRSSARCTCGLGYVSGQVTVTGVGIPTVQYATRTLCGGTAGPFYYTYAIGGCAGAKTGSR